MIEVPLSLEPVENTFTGAAGAFKAALPDAIHALASQGTKLFAGGVHRFVSGQPRARLAAMDFSGNLLSWNPSLNGTVYALAYRSASNTVYVGGAFTIVNGANVKYLTALNGSTGQKAAEWTELGTDGQVRALAFDSGAGFLYVGGNNFANAGGQARGNLAQLDLNGLATSWNPGANGTVETIALSGSRVFVGGSFSTLGGQIRYKLGSLSNSSSVAEAWDPKMTWPGSVRGLFIDGSIAYAAGQFLTVGIYYREHVAGIDINTGVPNGFAPNPANSFAGAGTKTVALSPSGNDVIVGGPWYFNFAGSFNSYWGAYDKATSAANTAINPRFGSSVNALLTVDGKIFVGGGFTSAGPPYLVRQGIGIINSSNQLQ